jgi:hypothetical protein
LTDPFFQGILPIMKGVRRVVFPLCAALALLAHAAMAQTNTPSRSARRYDSRIQMHAAPVTLQVPDESLEMQAGAPEPSERDMMIPSSLPQAPQARPGGPMRRTPQEKQQNKNWLLPLEPDAKTGDEEAAADKQEEPTPSGWGWLADDVRARQQKQEVDRKKSETGEKDNKLQPRSTLQKEDLDAKADGIFLDTAFKPVSSSTPAKETEKPGTEDDSSLEPGQDKPTGRIDGPTTAESPSSRTAADQPREQKFGADATWGNESLWNKNSKPVSMLPQTEALLSRSKIEAVKPLAGLERPGLMPGTAGREEPKLPEPARRALVTASDFHPLAATPVNELGAAPWDTGLPGQTPASASTPFSPEPSSAIARPIESLKAPELPKPAGSPWLK